MLTLGEHGALDDASIEELGLHVLAADGAQRLVVFPDDVEVRRLQRRIAEYATTVGGRYKGTAALESLRPLTREDRLGPRLAVQPLATGEAASLDVELWHSGDQAEMANLVDRLDEAIRPDGAVVDRYVGSSVCLLRVRATADLVEVMLDLDHVKEVDRRAEPSFELFDLIATPIDAYEIGDAPAPGAHGVVVVDSGVAAGHPMLAPVVADARSYVTTDSTVTPTHGHATWVAGLAAYGDVAASIARRRFEPSTWIFSAKVTETGNQYDPDQLIENQLRRLVADLTTDHPNIRVVNISLGDSRTPYKDGSLQFRLAAVVDEIAFDYRDREIVFTISAGNQSGPQDAEEAIRRYPTYLLDDASRVIDPATSLIGMTVGGLSVGEGRPMQLGLDTIDRSIADRTWPSSFTRTGPGHGGAIKPDLVDFAGDARFSLGRLLQSPQGSGLPTTSDEFGPPAGQLFRTVAGTSFAAPRVAFMAARLADAFPEASSNLIRALLVDSARIPDSRPGSLQGLDDHHPDILRIYGHGQPNLDSASSSGLNRVLMLADETMPIDHVFLYEVPALPRSFLETRGKGCISVSLAYDPPSRHTRSKDYLGIRMQFAMFRNASAEQVYNAIRAWSETETEGLEGGIPARAGLTAVSLDPGANTRVRGTLQRGIEYVSNTAWRYDGEPLILAVTCQRRWAPDSVDRQRFAVVVSIRHEDPTLDLYATLSARAQAYQQVRVRIPG